MDLFRRRLARTVVWLLIWVAASTGTPALALARPLAARATPATGQHCCCSGATSELMCPMQSRAAARRPFSADPSRAGSCHMVCCSANHDSMMLIGVLGLPLPASSWTLTFVSIALPALPPSALPMFTLTVPAPPPRALSARA